MTNIRRQSDIPAKDRQKETQSHSLAKIWAVFRSANLVILDFGLVLLDLAPCKKEKVNM